jgi:hypothetical protein
MAAQESRNPQHGDPQDKPVQKQQDPSGQPKSPQSEQEKHTPEQKKQA